MASAAFVAVTNQRALVVVLERPGDGVDVAARGGAAGVKGVGDGPAARATGRRQRERRAPGAARRGDREGRLVGGPEGDGGRCQHVTEREPYQSFIK